MLESVGLIRTTRGKIIMRDRVGLEDFARDAYGIPEAEYARLVGPMPKGEELAASAAVHSASQRTVDALRLDPAE
jgi:hypothetical protein